MLGAPWAQQRNRAELPQRARWREARTLLLQGFPGRKGSSDLVLSGQSSSIDSRGDGNPLTLSLKLMGPHLELMGPCQCDKRTAPRGLGACADRRTQHTVHSGLVIAGEPPEPVFCQRGNSMFLLCPPVLCVGPQGAPHFLLRSTWEARSPQQPSSADSHLASFPLVMGQNLPLSKVWTHSRFLDIKI